MFILRTGDDKQLGPKVLSKVTAHHNLQLSLMERLAAQPLYKAKQQQLVVHLVKNYRNHPLILKFLSDTFYDAKLKAEASEYFQHLHALSTHTEKSTWNALAQWTKKGTKKEFPFLFYGVEGGREEREGDSPSYFNITEASAIAALIMDMTKGTNNSKILVNSCHRVELRIDHSRIGVITPFYKQTAKIRQLLRTKGLGQVKVRLVALHCKLIMVPTLLLHR